MVDSQEGTSQVHVEQPQEKAYCCGNSSQREATLIAKFDLFWSFIFFCVFLAFLIVQIVNPNYFPDVAKNSPGGNNATTDLSAFLQWPRGAQLSVLSLLLVLHIVYIVLSIALLIGAKKRLHKILLIWFISTIVAYGSGLILTIVTVIYLHDKIAIGIGLLGIFLYKWYSLWIVKILMKEITSVSEADVYEQGIGIEEDDVVESAIPLDKF